MENFKCGHPKSQDNSVSAGPYNPKRCRLCNLEKVRRYQKLNRKEQLLQIIQNTEAKLSNLYQELEEHLHAPRVSDSSEGQTL